MAEFLTIIFWALPVFGVQSMGKIISLNISDEKNPSPHIVDYQMFASVVKEFVF